MSLKKASRTKSLSLSDDFPLRVTPQRSTSSPTNAAASTSLAGRHSFAAKRIEDTSKIFKYIDDNVIGKGVAFLGPFGRRKVVYADYTSSGRSLQFLEDYINKEVLPAYGDINCTSSVTGLQSQLYYTEAKDLIRAAVNATADDEIVFCEATYNSPVERIAYILCIRDGMDEYGPVLFVSTCEPDKNLRPWLDLGVQIEKIAKTHEGYLDLVDLEKKLSRHMENRRRLIGLFSGASRLSGILADDVATTILLHQYGAISVWDYSPAAPSTPIDTNPALPGSTKDAVFFCANKFIGGLQAPGVLIIKKSLLSHGSQTLYDSVGIVGAVRAGLVVQLKESLGTQNIMNRHEKLCKQMLAHIRTIPEINLLGPLTKTAKRIPTLCFLVRHPRGTYLHHRFVVAVLNDVFGIQATAQSTIVEAMSISPKMAVDYDRLLCDDAADFESLHPGYTQITLPFYIADAEVGFILEALKMVATEAWKLLPQYDIDNKTGEWKHQSNSLVKERKWLGAIRYTDGRMLFNDRRISGPGVFPQNYADCLQTARNLFNRARKIAQRTPTSENIVLRLTDADAEQLRWFILPGEAHELLLGHSQNVKHVVPFDPNKTMEPPSLLNMYRHNSLSALDVRRFKSRSLPTSPIHIPVRRQQSSPSPTHQSPIPERREYPTTPPIPKFSLGGEVTTLSKLNIMQNISGPESSLTKRNRCHSWSSTGGLSSLSPQTRMHLGLTSPLRVQRERMCSCSSQTELEEASSSENNSPLASLQEMAVASAMIGSDPDDIEAYVKCVTTDIALEIKSEIREVIAKVEDVLDGTDTTDNLSSLNMMSIHNLSSAEEMRNDSVSATDVAEYLKEFSKGITSQVTSEIREVVNVMNESEHGLTDHHYGLRRYTPPDIFNKTLPYPAKEKIKHRFSDITPQAAKRADCDKQRSESFPNPATVATTRQHYSLAATSPESSTPQCPYTGAISKLTDPVGTTSQDSGINMCFPDPDDPNRVRAVSSVEQNEDRPMMRSLSTRSQLSELTDEDYSSSSTSSCSKITCRCISQCSNGSVDYSTSFCCKRDSIDSDTDSVSCKDNSLSKWHYLPAPVWKQTAEAIDEFDMLKDGDKILVCLSGSSASLSLLHALRQFSRARGLHVELGAVSLGPSGVDPRALMLYLRDLNIKYIFDQLAPVESLRGKLYAVARQNGYNVLALGNSLDKLADDFLVSVLQKGRMLATQAHCANRDGDLRLIRPFVYVRERHLEDFSIQKELPTRMSKMFTKPPDASNSILKVQEAINPAVYENIKNALRPLMAQRLETSKLTYGFLKSATITRE